MKPASTYYKGFVAVRTVTLFFAVLFFGFTETNFAQSKRALHLTIKLDSEDKRWDTLQVLVQNDKAEIYYKKAGAINKLVLPYGRKFSLMFTKPGTMAKKIEVDTNVPNSVMKKKSVYTLHTTLIKREEGERTPEQKALECKTEVTIYYNEQTAAFDYKR